MKLESASADAAENAKPQIRPILFFGPQKAWNENFRARERKM